MTAAVEPELRRQPVTVAALAHALDLDAGRLSFDARAVLALLAPLADRDTGALEAERMEDLAKRLRLHRTRLVRALTELERARLVRRTPPSYGPSRPGRVIVLDPRLADEGPA